jgi:hypothetical protein
MLTRLQDLDLSGNRLLGDAGLRHLAGLTHLRSLGLSSVAVTDAGLQPLTRIASLRRLDLFATTVTGPGIKELRNSLPALTVEWYGSTQQPCK